MQKNLFTYLCKNRCDIIIWKSCLRNIIGQSSLVSYFMEEIVLLSPQWSQMLYAFNFKSSFLEAYNAMFEAIFPIILDYDIFGTPLPYLLWVGTNFCLAFTLFNAGSFLLSFACSLRDDFRCLVFSSHLQDPDPYNFKGSTQFFETKTSKKGYSSYKGIK